MQYLLEQPHPTTMHTDRLDADEETSVQCPLDRAKALVRRFEQIGQPNDLHEAIALYQTNLVTMHDAPRSSLLPCLYSLSYALRSYFELTSEMSCLEEAIALGHRSLEITMPLGLNDMAVGSSLNLAECLLLRYRYLCSVSDLEESVSLTHNVLSRCPEGHTQRPVALRCMAERYIFAYVSGVDIEPIVGHPPGLAEAIQCLQDARQLIRTDDNELPRILLLLAHVSYLCVSSEGPSPADIAETEPIHFVHEALSVIPSNPSYQNRIFLHVYLPPIITFAFRGCTAESHHHRQTRIEIARRTDKIFPERHVLKPVAMMELVLALSQDSWKEGSVESIEECIALCDRLLKFCPPPLPSQSMADSDDITLVFEARRTPVALPIAQHFRDAILIAGTDTEEAIQFVCAACIPLDIGTLRFVVLSTLSVLYCQRHHPDYGIPQFTYILKSLYIGIAAYHLFLPPTMEPNSGSLSEVMSWIAKRIPVHMHTNFMAGLVCFTTYEDMRESDLLGHWRNLTSWSYTKEQRWIVDGAHAEVSLKRLRHEKNVEGLEQYIKFLDIWVSVLAYASGESEVLIQAARARAFRYELLSDKRDLEKCKEIAEGLVADMVHPVVNRIRAAAFWAPIAASTGLVESASKAFDSALSLQSKLTFVMSLKTRMVVLKHSYGLPCDAACFELITRGDLRRAIERLEQGRGVLWSQAQSIRAPLSTVKHQALANRFKEIAERWRTETEFATDQEATRRREELSKEWDEVLERIRGDEPEMEAYLPGGRTWRELKEVAQDGSVVMLVGDEKTKRCFALMMRPASEGGDTYIELPTSVNLSKLRKMTQILGRANRTARDADVSDALEADRERYSKRLYQPSTHDGVLSELWISVVRPILIHLALKVSTVATGCPYLTLTLSS